MTGGGGVGGGVGGVGGGRGGEHTAKYIIFMNMLSL